MNKKALIITGIIVLLGLALYFVLAKKEAPKLPEQAENKINSRLADDSQMAPNQSLKDLLLRGQAMKCEFKDEQSESTFYMADQKMRGDVLINTDGKTMTNHTIMLDKISYTWVDGEKTGFKITAAEPELKNNSESAPAEKQEAVNLDKKADYKCSAWSKDASVFELPGDVEFKDLSSMIPASTPVVPASKDTKESDNNSSLKNTQCAACDKVPEASRAQCRAALGCK